MTGLGRAATVALAALGCLSLSLSLALAGCSERKKKEREAAEAAKKAAESGDTSAQAAPASATIKLDGSSTVFPISQAVAEEFQAKNKGSRVTIGVSGTGGGFKKFCRSETSISGASRPIKASEREACAKEGIEYIELPVAYDGIAVVVHKDNDWVDHLTVDELAKMWSPESGKAGIKKWSQIRASFPDKDFHLFGPGVDSGTYDYFTKAIVGTEHASRGDFTASEDDNVLVQGVASDAVALGFFGFAYYKENADKLKLIPIDDGNADNGAGPIAPSLETVAGGAYQPLSRPIFIYVNAAAADQPDIKAFVEFYLTQGAALAKEVGYIPLPDSASELVRKRFTDRVKGSLFEGGSKVGASVEDMLRSSGS